MADSTFVRLTKICEEFDDRRRLLAAATEQLALVRHAVDRWGISMAGTKPDVKETRRNEVINACNALIGTAMRLRARAEDARSARDVDAR